jgi:hypothetical protein
MDPRFYFVLAVTIALMFLVLITLRQIASHLSKISQSLMADEYRKQQEFKAMKAAERLAGVASVNN